MKFESSSRLQARWRPCNLLIAGLAVLSMALFSTVSAAQSLTKVRYHETIRSLMFTSTYIALSRGYFKDAGLDVELKTAQGTDKAMSALLTGSADIVLVGPEGVVYVANSESPVKPQIIASLVASDGFLMVDRKATEEPSSFDWQQLKGKTVMAYRPGSTPDVFLNTVLDRHDLDPETDMKIVNNIGPAARMGAWLAGQADYGIFVEPEASAIERQNAGRVVASIGHEVGEVDYTVFAAMPELIQSKPDVVRAWVSALSRAMKDAQEDALPAIAKDIAGFFPGLSEEELVQSLDRYRKYGIWKQTPAISESAIDTLQDMLIANKVLKADQRVSYDTIVAPELIQLSR